MSIHRKYASATFLKLILIASIFLAYCGVAHSQTTARSETLNVGLYMEPATMDPHLFTSTVDWGLIGMVYEGLVERVDGTATIGPKLAESWEVSEDGLRYTFHLRPNVTFHDGTPLDAEAVKFNFDRMSELGGGFSTVLADVARVEVVNPATVLIVLAEPFSPFLSGLTWVTMLSPASVREHEVGPSDWAQGWYHNNGVGTGPYEFIQWLPGDRLIHEPNKEYWGETVDRFARINSLVINEASTQRLMLESGDLDIVLLFSDDDFQRFQDSPAIETVEYPAPVQMKIRMNMVAGPTADRRVRQAISYSFDRGTYDLLRGTRPLADGPIASELLEGWAPEGVIHAFDPEKARVLFEEAGYPPGTLTLTYMYNTGDEHKRLVGEALLFGLAQAGVQLEIKVLTWAGLLDRQQQWFDGAQDPATAESMYSGFVNARVPDGWANLATEYLVGASRNMMFYDNPEVEELSRRAFQELDTEKRNALYREISNIIVNDVPDVFIDKLTDRAAFLPSVAGYRPDVATTSSVPYNDLYRIRD